MEKHELLRTCLGDVEALVGHGLQSLDGQLMGRFREGLRNQARALEERRRALGGSAASPLKEALNRVAGLAAGAIGAVRSEEPVRSLGEGYALVSHCSVAYLMLFTTAEALGDNTTASLAQRGYAECARMSIEMDRLIPERVLEELKAGGHPVVDVAARARDMVRVAWERGDGSELAQGV